MPRLYLIRRNLESFAGPMTVDEMKVAYKRMTFGLQDEVSGHCGPWISFDDFSRMKRTYPEVARMVRDDMLAGWGVSGPVAKGIDHQSSGKAEAKAKSRGMGLALTFLVIAILALGAAWYLANTAQLTSRLRESRGPTPYEARLFVEQNDVTGLEGYLHNNLDVIVALAQETDKSWQEWAPFLRLYAFRMNGGAIKGVSSKLLRGLGASAAPSDCSYRAWQDRWKKGARAWSSMVQGRKLVRAHWARVLAWDPHWIRRRHDKGQWLLPTNYYVGCLKMASRALTELGAVGSDRNVYDSIKTRLSWQVMAVSSGRPVGSLPMPTPRDALEQWSCIEAASSDRDLRRCGKGFSSSDISWKGYDDYRRAWAWVRIHVYPQASLPSVGLKELPKVISRLDRERDRIDNFTRFDYRAELRFLELVLKHQGRVDKARSRTESDYPDFKLSH